MNKLVLTGLLPAEICQELDLPQKFRGTQIFKWIGSGVTDFDAMTNLSADLRNSLKEKALLRSSAVSNVLKDPDGTASWNENGRRCYLICYSGDLYDKFSSVMGDSRSIESSSSFATSIVWQAESESGTDRTRFASNIYGGNGTSNIWLYLYCPYTSVNVYAAGSNGRAPQKGLVRVHLWSVSEKATFDYNPATEWISNGSFIPPWS